MIPRTSGARLVIRRTSSAECLIETKFRRFDGVDLPYGVRDQLWILLFRDPERAPYLEVGLSEKRARSLIIINPSHRKTITRAAWVR